MTINVTEEDIENGVPGSLTNCPVACGLNRETGMKGWRAGPRYIYFSAGVIHRMNTPLDVLEFMRNVDNHRLDVIKPFSFELTSYRAKPC